MTLKDTFYITTPIYYVNGAPHLGHAYSTIAADVMARFKRLDGYDVRFLTGTDEHGIKIFQTARDKGMMPQALCDEYAQQFRDILPLLNISNDDFIRTTEERHKKGAQVFWTKLQEAGAIYKGSYSGWYAVRDEAYYDESELSEKDGIKIAPTGAPVTWMEEESYFFALSKWQHTLLYYFGEEYDEDKLIEGIREKLLPNPDFIQPESARREVVSFVKGGLKDLSISRTSFDWGIPVPGDEKHVMYVWLDALSNYITALGYGADDDTLMTYWPADTHIVGKDIMRFHCVYWPAFLMAAGLPLPKKVFCTGWWTVDGEKMSKSLGNVLSPQDLVDKYGLDPLRYVLFRMVAMGSDGNFDQARAVDLINAFCANSLGNLAQRTLSFIQKNAGGVLPNCHSRESGNPHEIPDRVGDDTFVEDFRTHMNNFAFDKALDVLREQADFWNAYIDKNAPWALRKEEKFAEMETVLYNICEGLRVIAIMIQPFMPTSMNKLLDMLAVPADKRMFKHLTSDYSLKSGEPLPAPEALFPRLEG